MTKDVDTANAALTQDALAKFLTRERHAVHLIGVAGSGMSGIEGLLDRGQIGVKVEMFLL